MNEKLLDIAANEGKKGVLLGDGGPFGALIVDLKGNIISYGHNMVLKSKDPTLHAEIVAIKNACQKLHTSDLSNYVIYSSCEPCPMCLGAIIWANIKTIYFGASRLDAAKVGFRDEAIYDYLSGKNKMIKVVEEKNVKCIDLLSSYNGDIY